jgi:hypothetical protein
MKRLSAVKMRWVWVICFRPCDASVICLQRDPYASLPSQPVLTSPGLITFSIKSRSSLAHVFPVPFPSTTTRTVLSPGARPPGLAYWRGKSSFQWNGLQALMSATEWGHIANVATCPPESQHVGGADLMAPDLVHSGHTALVMFCLMSAERITAH